MWPSAFCARSPPIDSANIKYKRCLKLLCRPQRDHDRDSSRPGPLPTYITKATGVVCTCIRNLLSIHTHMHPCIMVMVIGALGTYAGTLIKAISRRGCCLSTEIHVPGGTEPGEMVPGIRLRRGYQRDESPLSPVDNESLCWKAGISFVLSSGKHDHTPCPP